MKAPWLILTLALASGADAACSNPMLPADSGSVWIYARTEAGRTDTYAVRRMSDDQGNVTEESAAPGALPQQHYRCVAGEMQPTDASVDVPGLQARVLGVRGTALPALGDWRVGSTWNYTVDLEASMQGPLKLSGRGSMDVAFRVMAQEPVTVAAGRFTAYRVDVTRTLTGKLGVLPYQKVLRQTEWFVPGVGLVRRDSADARTELLDQRGE